MAELTRERRLRQAAQDEAEAADRAAQEASIKQRILSASLFNENG